MSPDTRGWTPIGESKNARFFEIETGLLAVVPTEGCTDDEKTASESIRIQLAHLRAAGVRGSSLIFMDPVASQTSGARAVYRKAPDPAFLACFALLGGTAFGRAVGSFFLGLAKPRVPTRMFSTEDEAIAWARAMRDDR